MLHCPFCESIDLEVLFVEKIVPGEGYICAVHCLNCGAMGPHGLGKNAAILGWNACNKKTVNKLLAQIDDLGGSVYINKEQSV
jgi:hypothetical protein